MAKSETVLTASEVIALLGRLEGGGFSARQANYLRRQGVVLPSVHQPRAHGDAALFSLVDLGLLRLVLRLRRAGVPAWIVRAIVLYEGAELRAELSKRRPSRVLVVEGARGHVLSEKDAEGRGWYQLPLESVSRGLEAAVRKLRRERPDVWAGWRRVPAALAAEGVRA